MIPLLLCLFHICPKISELKLGVQKKPNLNSIVIATNDMSQSKLCEVTTF